MIRIETPTMTIGQLAKHIDRAVEPVRRSTHIGNQPPRELAIMAGLPPGVDVLMVDTIHGDDAYTKPRMLISGDLEEPLVSRSKANGRVVGSLRIHNSEDKVTTIHNGVLNELDLNNKPHVMMRFFSQYPDFLMATVVACAEAGEVHRRVTEEGKIISHQTPAVDKVYGLNGSTHGVLLPLNGMMVMDTLISETQGSDSTLHLGGADMMRYTSDPERMQQVSLVRDAARASLGKSVAKHHYRVIDSRGLAVAATSRSQHEMKRTGEAIDISPHLYKSTGISA